MRQARNVDHESKHHDRMSAGRKTHQLMRQAAGIGYGSANQDLMNVSRMKESAHAMDVKYES